MNRDYDKKLKLAKICPVCGKIAEKDNWQLYWPSGHFEVGGKKDRRNFHDVCWIVYNQRVEHEESVFNNEITRAEIASQVECPRCHKKSIFTYTDDSENRPNYVTWIYQCMDCGYLYPVGDMEEVIKAVKEKMNGKTPTMS
jgi:rubredoxin